jgi:hypothetical protein
MRKLNLALGLGSLVIAIVTIGSVMLANAQVSIRAGDNGVGVRIGEPYRTYHPHYHVYGRADCRTVTVRKHRPNGTVVVTKTRVCD